MNNAATVTDRDEFFSGMLNFRKGDHSSGLRLRTDGIDDFRNAGFALGRSAALKECMESLGRVGEIARAQAAIDEALVQSSRNEEFGPSRWRENNCRPTSSIVGRRPAGSSAQEPPHAHPPSAAQRAAVTKSLYRASRAAELHVLQVGQILSGELLLSIAGGLHAVVAQKVRHEGGILVGLERAWRGQRHGLNHYGPQLRAVEM